MQLICPALATASLTCSNVCCSLERLKKEPELLQADQDQLNRQAQVMHLTNASLTLSVCSTDKAYACGPCSPCVIWQSIWLAQHAILKRSSAQ